MKFVFCAVLACFLFSPAVRAQAKPPAGTEELRSKSSASNNSFPAIWPYI